MARLFVYGSLQRGCSNAGLLEGAVYLGPRVTREGFGLVEYRDGYPALHPEPSGRGQVQGELYLVGEALLIELDAFEDCPVLYQREEIDLSDRSQAYAYCITAGVAERFAALDDGAWRD